MYITSIESPQIAESIVVYPVPSSGVFTLNMKNVKENVEVSIFNTVGQVVVSMDVAAADKVVKELTIPDAKAGLYIIELTTESGEKVTRKLMVH